MKHLRLQVALSGLLALSLLPLQAIQAAGAKVLTLDGIASKTSSDGSKANVSTGDILTEGDELIVGALSQLELVFSNGSMLTVMEKSSLTIETLQQEDFSGDKSYEQLQADPSKSQTLLELNYGKVEGHVKKLQQGSSFDVASTLGTAAIRGTRFRCAVGFSPTTGDMVLSITNLDGAVNLNAKFRGLPTFNNGIASLRYNSSSNAKDFSMAPNTTVNFSIGRNDPAFSEMVSYFNIEPSELGKIAQLVKEGQLPAIFTEEQNSVPPQNEEQGDEDVQQTPPGGPVSPSTPI